MDHTPYVNPAFHTPTEGEKVTDGQTVFTVGRRASLRYWRAVDASGRETMIKHGEFVAIK